MVDIKHKTCVFDGCKIRSSYNKIDKTKAIYCVKHKTSEMIDVFNKTCISIGCKTHPTYNIMVDYQKGS